MTRLFGVALRFHVCCTPVATSVHDSQRRSGAPCSVMRARVPRAEVRRREPSRLARMKRSVRNGPWKREGKIKGAARVCSPSEHSCGFATARAARLPCRIAHATRRLP